MFTLRISNILTNLREVRVIKIYISNFRLSILVIIYKYLMKIPKYNLITHHVHYRK